MHGSCGLDMDLIKQNGSDWVTCEHETCRMQQWTSKKDPGGKELNKRDPYLKMCLPGDLGKGGPSWERRSGGARFPFQGQAKESSGRAVPPLETLLTTACFADLEQWSWGLSWWVWSSRKLATPSLA